MRQSRQEGRKMNTLFLGLGRTIAGVFAVGALSGFLSNVIDVRAEFEKYEAVLSNAFQSAAAGQTAMAMIKDFASTTPYQLNELTGAYVKLVNRGFIPTEKNMRSLGDLAASQGKSFDQLTEAILDAESQEFERLKEFGIKAKKAGDNVTLSFKGVNKTVKANSKSIREAVLGFGDMTGVAGSMAVVSKTLGGRISNLKDSWGNLLNEIGKSGGGILGNVIDYLNKAVRFFQRNLQNITNWFSKVKTSIISLAIPFKSLLNDVMQFVGISDLAAASSSLLQNIFTGLYYVIDTLVTGISTLINWFLALPTPIKNIVYGLSAFKVAMTLVNLAMLASPITWYVAGIMAIIGVIGLATKYTSGWGDSWNAVKIIFANAWESIKANFSLGVDRMGYHFEMIYLKAKDTVERITGTFSNLKQALELALSGDFSKAWDKANERVITKASQEILQKNEAFNKKIEEYNQQKTARDKATNQAMSDFGIKVDFKAISKDFKNLKDKFSNATTQNATTGNYQTDVVDKFSKSTSASASAGQAGADGSLNGITGGGQKQTNINISLQKLVEKIELHSTNVTEGVDDIESKLTEMLLRVLNSVNQVQGA